MKTHGKCNSRIYRIWWAMRMRCYNKKHVHYASYGGRGIRICDRWLFSFEAFCADMGDPPSNRHSIERKDNNKNYSKSNCKWATTLEQGQNTRNNHNVTAFGKTRSISAWSRELGFNRRTILNRLKKGETLEEVVKNPPHWLRLLEARGVVQPLCEWARDLGVTPGAISERLKRGQTMEQIVEHYAHS
jgi:uncharacterized protein (DUF433 family)